MTDHNIILRFKGVSLNYRLKSGLFQKRVKEALSDISFNLNQGETLGVVGRNGSGKSTLLKLISGVTKPDKGEICKYSDYTASLLTLSLGFRPYLTGRENAILGGMLFGCRYAQVKSKLNEIIEFSETDEYFDQPLHTYSAGMRARLGFATALALEPDIILIDELLGVGDTKFKEKSTKIMKAKIKSNKTVVLVSHSDHVIKELCDRVIVIDQGRVVFEGDVEAGLAAYRNILAN